MSVSKNELLNGKRRTINGKESVSAEMKRLFKEINFGTLTKSEFVSKMLEGVFGPANEVHEMVKHLESVWRGKAAPTMRELAKAQHLEESTHKTQKSRVEKSLARMNISGAEYQPKYPATQKLKEKMQTSKKS